MFIEKTKIKKDEYLVMGYDAKNHHTKHYRKYLKDGIEKSQYMDKSPFDEISIYRGKKVKGDQVINAAF